MWPCDLRKVERRYGLYYVIATQKLTQPQTLFVFFLLCWFLLPVIVCILTPAFRLSFESSAHCWIQLNTNMLLQKSKISMSAFSLHHSVGHPSKLFTSGQQKEVITLQEAKIHLFNSCLLFLVVLYYKWYSVQDEKWWITLQSQVLVLFRSSTSFFQVL